LKNSKDTDTAPTQVGHLVEKPAALAAAVFLMTITASTVMSASRLPHTDGPNSEASASEIAGYQARLADYNSAREAFAKAVAEYWRSIAAKRKIRFELRSAYRAASIDDYVFTQPPIYVGPPQPLLPPSLQQPPGEGQAPPPKNIPLVADFLADAATEFGFVPERPATELEFKRAYAKAAAAAGLSKDQIVRIYAFETGGDGTYDLQAGFEKGNGEGHAVSAAIGYAQLLPVNTIELLAENGDQFLAALREKSSAAALTRKASLINKVGILQNMITYARSVPDDWAEHLKLANTRKGLGIHALNLDIDVGPLLQVENLVTSVKFARRHGLDRELTAVELEMMNLAGDGSGFDMMTIPTAYRDVVPTANFFEPDGYEANPIVIRNNTVGRLLGATNAQMDKTSEAAGSRDIAFAY
jgi:hypothetical protein